MQKAFVLPHLGLFMLECPYDMVVGEDTQWYEFREARVTAGHTESWLLTGSLSIIRLSLSLSVMAAIMEYCTLGFLEATECCLQFWRLGSP